MESLETCSPWKDSCPSQMGQRAPRQEAFREKGSSQVERASDQEAEADLGEDSEADLEVALEEGAEADNN